MGLNVKHKITKFLEQNTGQKLCELGLGKEFLFLDLPPKVRSVKILISWT